MTFGSSEHQNRVGITWSKVGGKVYHLTYSQSIILKGSMLQQLCYPSPSTECLRLLVEGSRTDDTEGSRSVSLEFSVPVDIWSYEHLRGWSWQDCNICCGRRRIFGFAQSAMMLILFTSIGICGEAYHDVPSAQFSTAHKTGWNIAWVRYVLFHVLSMFHYQQTPTILMEVIKRVLVIFQGL